MTLTMTIVPPEYNSVKTPPNPNYYAMSKGDLVAIIESQKAVIQRFYRLLPVPNKVLAPGEKLAWAVAKPLIEREKPNEQGLVRIPIDEIAEKIGMSDSSASRYIQNICERFDATHQVEPYITKKGQQCNLTYINPDDPIWATYPDELTLPAEKERTINGNQCPHCRSTGTLRVKKRHITTQDIVECAACGYTKVYPVEQVNEPLPPAEYCPPKKAPQPEEPFPESSEPEKGPQPEDLFSAEKVENLHCLRVDTVAIIPPETLRSLRIWCCHRAKEPYDARPARSPQKAKSNDPATWTTYEQALATYQDSQSWKYPYDGIMWACPGEFTGIDLDHCINEQGEISDQAAEIVALFGSYTYITPSGAGLRIIVRGKKPGPRCRWPGIEIYDQARFFTWTPDHLAGTPETIEDGQAELHALYKELVPEPVEFSRRRENITSNSNDEILKKARTNAKFAKLWSGDASDYRKADGSPDHSRADLALCEILAWAGGDVSTIDGLFRNSGLMREKWNRADYRERTINRALGLQERRAS